jgi:antitoxin MazE
MRLMKARIIRIGNSRGIRLPKALLDQSGLSDEVQVEVKGDRVVIHSCRLPRDGWADAFRLLADDVSLDEPTSASFDETEWEW